MRKLENWIDTYTRFTKNTEAPYKFHQWTAVSTIAGALNRKCWVNIGRFPIYPSFYIVFVAPPGIATKSTTAKQGMELLDEANAINIFEGKLSFVGLFDELKDSERVITHDTGTMSMCAMQLFASELGVLMGNDDLIDYFVDMWDGKPSVKYRTRSGGKLEIPRPHINMLACTTPSWLTKNAGLYAIDGGFFSRTIFVYASEKEQLIAYPDAVVSEDIRKDLIADLEMIGNLVGEFKMTDEALAWGNIWYTETHKLTPPHLASPLFQAYLSRRQAHLHKVAMVVSASKKTDMIIDLEDMIEAEEMLLSYEKDLKIIYESVHTNEKTEAYRVIKDYLKSQNERVKKTEVFQQLASAIAWQDFELAVQGLIFAREVKMSQSGNDVYLAYNRGES